MTDRIISVIPPLTVATAPDPVPSCATQMDVGASAKDPKCRTGAVERVYPH